MATFFDQATFASLSSTLAESSIKKYSGNIKNIFKAINETVFSVNTLITKKKEIIDYIATLDITKQSQFYATIIAVLKANNIIDNDFTQMAQVKHQSAQDAVIYRPPNDTEVEKQVSMKDVKIQLDRWKRLTTEDPTNIKCNIGYVICGLYYYLPPKRGGEYCNTSLTNQSHPNYLDMSNWTLKITDGKTMRNKAAQSINIPIELQEIISTYCNNTESPWLICQVDSINEHQTTDGLSHFMKRNLHFTPTTLRNVFVSEMNDNLDTTIQDRKDAAGVMGHSVATQQLIYTKYSEQLHNPPMLTLSNMDEIDIPVVPVDSIETEITKLKEEIARKDLIIKQLEELKMLKQLSRLRDNQIKNLQEALL